MPHITPRAGCLLAERVSDIFHRDENGHIPAFTPDSPFQIDPHWQDLMLFNEYYHGKTGQCLGASHQTGWPDRWRICC